MNRRNFLAGLFGATTLAALTPIAGFAIWDRARLVRLPTNYVIHWQIIGGTPEDQAEIDKWNLARAA